MSELEKHTTVSLAIPLTSSLTSITLAHNWLSTTILIIHLQQFIIQAVHPSSSPLYQLPFMNEDTISAAAKLGIKDISQFGKMKSGEESKVIVDLDTTEKKECFEVAKNWPVIKVVNAKFEGLSF